MAFTMTRTLKVTQTAAVLKQRHPKQSKPIVQQGKELISYHES
jgi:hypothetical protein